MHQVQITTMKVVQLWSQYVLRNAMRLLNICIIVLAPFMNIGLSLSAAWISRPDHMLNKVWDEITYLYWDLI